MKRDSFSFDEMHNICLGVTNSLDNLTESAAQSLASLLSLYDVQASIMPAGNGLFNVVASPQCERRSVTISVSEDELFSLNAVLERSLKDEYLSDCVKLSDRILAAFDKLNKKPQD